MTLPMFILALITVAGAVAAVSLRRLVHCAFCLVATFAGLAGLYLGLDAQFVGLVQLLVYVGAVAILIVFASLLTRGDDGPGDGPWWKCWPGVSVAVLVFSVLAGAVLSSGLMAPENPEPAPASVKAIGALLMSDYVVPLEAIGLLLTAALIGAVIIAMDDRKPRSSGPGRDGSGGGKT